MLWDGQLEERGSITGKGKGFIPQNVQTGTVTTQPLICGVLGAFLHRSYSGWPENEADHWTASNVELKNGVTTSLSYEYMPACCSEEELYLRLHGQ